MRRHSWKYTGLGEGYCRICLMARRMTDWDNPEEAKAAVGNGYLYTDRKGVVTRRPGECAGPCDCVTCGAEKVPRLGEHNGPFGPEICCGE